MFFTFKSLIYELFIFVLLKSNIFSVIHFKAVKIRLLHITYMCICMYYTFIMYYN